MTAEQAVDATPHLNGKWERGLRALRAEDRPHIKAADTRAITGSVDVDTALRRVEPKANRWDFAIGYQHEDREGECLYWVELHTANDSQVNVVIRKLRWLLNWLAREGSALDKENFERDFVWVSSGSTHYTLNGSQRRAFADLGLRQTGGRLTISKNRG
jgi:hypothetical protein